MYEVFHPNEKNHQIIENFEGSPPQGRSAARRGNFLSGKPVIEICCMIIYLLRCLCITGSPIRQDFLQVICRYPLRLLPLGVLRVIRPEIREEPVRFFELGWYKGGSDPPRLLDPSSRRSLSPFQRYTHPAPYRAPFSPHFGSRGNNSGKRGNNSGKNSIFTPESGGNF